ncbi:MAG: hypothetical protein ACI4OJ_11270 [Lachnospiraceae bacterium]
MKDIRILEEAIGRAVDDAGKIALVDLVSENLSEFVLLMPHFSEADLPIPLLPLFTSEDMLRDLPKGTLLQVTLQEAFELTLDLPDCRGVVFNPVKSGAPALSVGGIRAMLCHWDRRSEDAEEAYEGLDKRMLIMRLLLALPGASKQKVLLLIQQFHLLCMKLPAKQAEDCLDEALVYLEGPGKSWQDASERMNGIFSRFGITEEELLLVYGGEDALDVLLENKDFSGACCWARVHAKERELASRAVFALQFGRRRDIPGASLELGKWYEAGILVEPDENRAKACYAADAARGDGAALYRFARLLRKKDPEKALALFRQGAELTGDPGCLKALGDAVFFGDLPGYGEEDGFHFYQRSLRRTYEAPGSEEERPGALLRVGLCLLYGRGTGESPARALGYIRQAAGLYGVRGAQDEEKAFFSALLCEEAKRICSLGVIPLRKGDTVRFLDRQGDPHTGTVKEILEENRFYRIREESGKDAFVRKDHIQKVLGQDFGPIRKRLSSLPLVGIAAAQEKTNPAFFGALAVAEGLLSGAGKSRKEQAEALSLSWGKFVADEPVPVPVLAAPIAYLAGSVEEADALADLVAGALSLDGDETLLRACARFGVLARMGKRGEELLSALHAYEPMLFDGSEDPVLRGLQAAALEENFTEAVQRAKEVGCPAPAAGATAELVHRVPAGLSYAALVRMNNDERQILRKLGRSARDTGSENGAKAAL